MDSLLLSQNVTLRFFPDGSEETCSYENSTNALTFTTFSMPILGHCFNLADLFSGNATRGFVNQTGNLLPNWRTQEQGIAWQLENMKIFDPQANYSRVLYRQSVYNPQDKRYEPGSYAWRRINIYGGVNCTELDPAGDALLDWYGFNCFSEGGGSCGTLPYSIASFNILPGAFEKEDEQHGKCMVFAQLGTAARHQLPRVVIGAFICALLAVWLAC